MSCWKESQRDRRYAQDLSSRSFKSRLLVSTTFRACGAQLRPLFARLAEKTVAVEAGEPDLLKSNFVNGIKRMSVSVTPR